MPGQTDPISWVEAEAALLLTLPLVELAENVSGEGVLAVDTRTEEHRIAGVHVAVERGRLLSCVTDLPFEPPTFALGSPTAWLGATIDRQIDRLYTNGDQRLIRNLVDGIHRALFGAV